MNETHTQHTVRNHAMQSENINELASALCQAQGEIEGATKDSANPFFKSKYADFHAVRQACREPMHNAGLSFVQTTEILGEKLCLITLLMHKSGQWIKSILPIPVGKGDAQSMGSAMTYCRRYALSAIVGVSTYDDDGEAAMKEERKPVQKEKIKEADFVLPNLKDLQDAIFKAFGKHANESALHRFLLHSSQKFDRPYQAGINLALSDDKTLKRVFDAFEAFCVAPLVEASPSSSA